MMRLRILFAGSCPRHPRYAPHAGPGAVKAGCPRCWQLWRIYRTAEQLNAEIAEFDELFSGDSCGPHGATVHAPSHQTGLFGPRRTV